MAKAVSGGAHARGHVCSAGQKLIAPGVREVPVGISERRARGDRARRKSRRASAGDLQDGQALLQGVDP